MTKITKACVYLSLVFSILLHKFPPSLLPLPNPFLPQLLPPPCHWSAGRLHRASNLFSPPPSVSSCLLREVGKWGRRDAVRHSASVTVEPKRRWEMIGNLSADLPPQHTDHLCLVFSVTTLQQHELLFCQPSQQTPAL